MNELKWMTEIAKEFGRKHLPNFTNGIIKVVIEDGNTEVDKKIGEIVKIMVDMCAVLVDDSHPWDAMDAKKDSSPQGAPEGKLIHHHCNIDISKVESLMDQKYIKQILRNEG